MRHVAGRRPHRRGRVAKVGGQERDDVEGAEQADHGGRGGRQGRGAVAPDGAGIAAAAAESGADAGTPRSGGFPAVRSAAAVRRKTMWAIRLTVWAHAWRDVRRCWPLVFWGLA